MKVRSAGIPEESRKIKNSRPVTGPTRPPSECRNPAVHEPEPGSFSPRISSPDSIGVAAAMRDFRKNVPAPPRPPPRLLNGCVEGLIPVSASTLGGNRGMDVAFHRNSLLPAVVAVETECYNPCPARVISSGSAA